MRAMLCHCRHRLEAEDDETLLVLDQQVMEIVPTRAYNFEYVEVPADAELAPEPFQNMSGMRAS